MRFVVPPRLAVWKYNCIPLLLLRSTLLGLPACSFNHRDFQYNHHQRSLCRPLSLFARTTTTTKCLRHFQPLVKSQNKPQPLFQSHNDGRYYETIPDERKDRNDDPTELARMVFSKLANRGKSWQRLGPLIEMACGTSETTRDTNGEYLHHDGSHTFLSIPTLATTSDVQPPTHHQQQKQQRLKSIVDVGCDHGLLTVGLAASGCFNKVLGVDVSEPALQHGAFSLYEEFQRDLEFIQKNASASTASTIAFTPSALEFRVGDGLQGLRPGEADAICVAGMGFQTMIQILATRFSELGSPDQTHLDNDSDTLAATLQLDRLACQALYLQPANSKPIYLMMLYDTLQDMGWCVAMEHMTEISSRWYMTTMFVRRSKARTTTNYNDDDNSNSDATSVKELPGCRLLMLEPSHPMKRHYQNYVAHHTQWMRSDLTKKGKLDDQEMRWLQHATSGS